MKMFFRSIQKWMRERKVRRELQKDQDLRERCVDYVVKGSKPANAYLAEARILFYSQSRFVHFH